MGWLCYRILGSPALPVLIGLVLAGWIKETPGLMSMVLNVPASLLSFIQRALQVIRVLPTTDQVTIEAAHPGTVRARGVMSTAVAFQASVAE